MNLEPFYRSVLEQDRAAVVICALDHTIVYMNPAAAARYASDGGASLVGRSIKVCHPPFANDMIDQVVDWFRQDPQHNVVYTFRNERENKDVYMVALRDDDGNLIGYYEKHEYRDRESRMKLYDMPE